VRVVHRRIADFWQQLGATAELPRNLMHQTMLWASVRSLAAFEEKRWEHGTEIVGAQELALKVAEAHPEEWARALPWLLARTHLLRGFIEATTLVLARDSEPVRTALHPAARPRRSGAPRQLGARSGRRGDREAEV
jgi:hypothetical protein